MVTVTVASFPPEFVEALRVGARQRLRVDLATFRDADRLWHRFDSLKAALRRENSQFCIVTDKTLLNISEEGRSPAWLEIRPANSEFADILAAAFPPPDAPCPTSIVHSEVMTDFGLTKLARRIREMSDKSN